LPDAAAADKQIQETSQSSQTEKKNLHSFQELRNDIPAIRPGDELKIYYRVIEAGKERIQIYEGTVISIKNAGISKTITVRKNSFGIAVERIFPLNSILSEKIERQSVPIKRTQVVNDPSIATNNSTKIPFISAGRTVTCFFRIWIIILVVAWQVYQ
jgi:ribosomal protein L19